MDIDELRLSKYIEFFILMKPEFSRPTTIEELLDRLSRLPTQAGYRAGLEYHAAPSDIFIATYPKCGTTWMQQLVHCLRTRGDMDFGEITEVVPWLEMSYDTSVDNNTPQKASPQCFKSHLSWSEIPKGGKYIHITRNPQSVLLSYYHFFNGWFFEQDSIDIETFSDRIFFEGLGPEFYWHHVNEWWAERNRKDVLFLCYEHMLDNPTQQIESAARFMGVNLDNTLFEIAKEKSSAAFMCQHVSHFNDHVIRQKLDSTWGLPDGGTSNKISLPSRNRKKRVLPESIKQKLKRIWREIVTPVTGLDDYEALLFEVRSE